ncbi:MAG: ankyrin repeat domain-containing protein [Candidatus Dependentiae bacterium]|nr:ankyrin repeat domain-containing protein [Candidatus Dependentiae bacterium]
MNGLLRGAVVTTVCLMMLSRIVAGSGDPRALFKAVEDGNIDGVKAALKSGIRVNAKNSDGETALFDAARRGNFELVRYLIERGADVNAKNQNRDATVLSMLAGRVGEGVDKRWNLELAKYLVEKGADVNAKPWFPLATAAGAGNLEMAKYLIKHGADVNTKGSGMALRNAAYKGNLEMVKYLIEHGANPRLTHPEDRKPIIEVAREQNHQDVANYLAGLLG